MIENVNCSWDEPRLRDCPYSNHTMTHSCQSGRVAGVRCKVIRNIEFSTVNNSVLVTWEYSNNTSHQPSSFLVRCNGYEHYINSVSNGTSRVSDIVGHLLSHTSYDCCVSANHKRRTSSIITTDIRCASIRSEDLLTPTTISDTNSMITTVTVVGAVLGCVIVINPRRMRRRVTVVVLCVCLSVCLSVC